jgi:hypothetical protein
MMARQGGVSSECSSGLRERIEQAHTGGLKVRRVPGNHRQVVNQGSRRDLFIQGILWIGHAQPSPNVRRFFIERDNVIGEVRGDLFQPALEMTSGRSSSMAA